MAVNFQHFGFAFDLNTVAMRSAGISSAQRNRIYDVETKWALVNAGFVKHQQGSLYVTAAEQDPRLIISKLEGILKGQAPNFCRFLRNAYLFCDEPWSDVTAILANPEKSGTVNHWRDPKFVHVSSPFPR